MKNERRWFLQSVSCMFLFAFGSLYVQIPGLYGDRGILPARAVLKPMPNSVQEFFHQPSVLRYASLLGLSVEQAMDACCITGITFSSLSFLFNGCRTSACYFILWILYLGLYEVGQTFLWFQWDILLLEVGFLCIFIADVGIIRPFFVLPKFPHSSMAMILIRWLLFRLMFTSGVVKLMSKCPTWWQLTALNYHYESQCIPTPLAWYAHQLPDWFQKYSVASTFLIQIPLSFLFFSPISSLAIATLLGQVFLQILIILTGNYNFFNLTTIALCIPLLDGGKVYHRFLELVLPRFLCSKPCKIAANIFGSLIGFAITAWIGVTYFSFRLDSIYPPVIFSKLAFTESQLDLFTSKAAPTSIFVVGSMLIMAVVTSLAKAIWGRQNASLPLRVYRFFATATFSLACIGLFAVACIPYCRGLHQPLPKFLSDIGAVSLHSQITEHYNLPVTSSYGLFRRMTGVGGRPEVIVEAAMDRENGPWLPYEFLYKPGNVSGRPPVVAPHQPRLDWQMWFLALGSYQHNPWFLSLCERLLSAEPNVLALLHKAPFQGKPRFLRAKLYHYHYSTDFHGKYWWRREFQSEFLPIVAAQDLAQHVAKMRVPAKPKVHQEEFLLPKLIASVRDAVGQPEGFMFLSSLFVGLVATRILLNKMQK